MSPAGTTELLDTGTLGPKMKPTVVDRTTEEEDREVERQLRVFVGGEVDRWRPDLIVVHERKGSAIFRALIESHSDPIEWPWSKVISSAALEQLRSNSLKDRRILIFDDMWRTGVHLQPIFDQIKRLCGESPGPSKFLRLAIFAAHEDISHSGFERLDGISYSWFHRDLTTPAYVRIRSSIVRMLQRCGSLMLDTEHIEVRLTLHGTFHQLVTALRRRAEATVFESLGGRTNVTVCYEDDGAHELSEKSFPAGSNLLNVVKKCRIVQRDPNEFAIIPICLPSVAGNLVDWPQGIDAEIFANGGLHSESAVFYGAALIASLQPLKWLLRDLYAVDPKVFDVSLPLRSSEAAATAGYSLEHLTVMYPTLNVQALADRIAQVEREARLEGGQLRGRKTRHEKAEDITDDDLHRHAFVLLQLVAKLVDDKHIRTKIRLGRAGSRSGLRFNEVVALGERLRWRRAHVSALFDILIDDGNLVTRVEQCIEEDGQTRWARTFKPDGEVVTELVRHLTVQWGLPLAL
jgi:hypothetical protein